MKSFQEWFLQSDYDINTAEAMFDSGRYFYSAFMCHLSIEKCLKGLHAKILNELPPKTHNLIYLLEKISLEIPDNIYKFIYSINAESVATRYPEDLKKVLKDYSKEKSKEIIDNSKLVLEWLKKN
ncbi:MAG TPA: HEPN domain-containing protein [Ignavibacteriaceae bacterium]|nr:HEPN domain-containing protein [Ignavibacteriaceae bacterium]